MIISADVAALVNRQSMIAGVDIDLVPSYRCELEGIHQELIAGSDIYHCVHKILGGRPNIARAIPMLECPLKAPEDTRINLVLDGRCGFETFRVVKHRCMSEH